MWNAACQAETKGFFAYRIVTGDEKWIHDNPKKRKSWESPGHASTSTTKPNIHGKNSCCVFGGISLVSYIISCSNRTRPLLGLSTEHNWWLSRALEEKRAHYYFKHDKIILLHDNARPRVAAPVRTYLETQMGSSTPSPVFSIAPSDYHLFRSMTHDLSE